MEDLVAPAVLSSSLCQWGYIFHTNIHGVITVIRSVLCNAIPSSWQSDEDGVTSEYSARILNAPSFFLIVDYLEYWLIIYRFNKVMYLKTRNTKKVQS